MQQLNLFESGPAVKQTSVPEVVLVPLTWLYEINSCDGDNLRDVFFDHDEDVDEDTYRIEELMGMIEDDGFRLRHPVCVVWEFYDREGDGWVISDGHHRIHALENLGCSYVPVYFCDEDQASSSQSLRSPLPHVKDTIALEELYAA